MISSHNLIELLWYVLLVIFVIGTILVLITILRILIPIIIIGAIALYLWNEIT